MISSRRTALGTLVCAAVLGCGPGGISAPSTAPVTGTVMFKGKPAVGVKVTFHPKFDMGTVKFTPSGLTDKAGKFSLSTAAANDGAPPGDYSVTFELLKGGSDKAGLDIEVDAWKGKYADPAAGKWPATVHSGPNELEPFKLD